MNKGLALLPLICLLAVSCSIRDSEAIPERDVFYATLESYDEPDTRVYVNNKVTILWDADDRISIFEESAMNREYRFLGATGDNAGEFDLVRDPFGTGTPLDYFCAVYPYSSSTKIKEDYLLHLNLPAEQVYRADSFGRGANVMVSVTEDHLLKFKNVGGYLVLKFYGEGASVASIKLEGRGDELLSGEAVWKPTLGAFPEFTLLSGGGKSITLVCPEPVELGTTAESASVFWMVVPRTHFSQGFKLTVTGSDDRVFVKETSLDLTVERNGVVRISPIRVVFPDSSV